MYENNEEKKDNYVYQSFSKNDIFIVNNEETLRTNNKEQIIEFSFKKQYEFNNELTSTTKNAKNKLLNIYSKDDKNIIQSGHFAKIQTKNKKKYKEFIKPDTSYLIKALFVDSSNSKNNSTKKNKIKKENKENLKMNLNSDFSQVAGGGEENLFKKIKTKTRHTLPIKNYKDINHNINNKPFLNKKLLTEINNLKNISNKIKNKNGYKMNNILNFKNNIVEQNKKSISNSKNNSLKKKIIRINNNKLFISSNTNTILNSKNMNLSKIYNNSNSTSMDNSVNKSKNNSINKNIRTKNINNLYYLNKGLDINFREKNITDSLCKKINTINKRLILFSEYNKKLKKQIKDLNEDISSFENSMNKSKKEIKSERRNTSIGYLTSSANKNNSSYNNSDIKSFLFKRKIKPINISNIKNKNSLNKSLREHHKNVTNLVYVKEFSAHSNKKSNSKSRSNQNSKNKTKFENNSKNKDINYKKCKIEQKDVKKRRIQSNNLYDYSHFKKVPPI